MIARRDLLITVAAAGLTAGAFALADKPEVMGSTAFDWNSIPVKTTEVGSVRQVVSKPTATLENLEVHITTLNPGKSPHPPHRHPNEEMLIIRQGTLEALINGEWKRVGPGSVIFFASNQLHGVKNVGDEPAIYHVVNWKTAATPDATHP
jgi:XRE family transcriptional regulator, regulator of sulfur utilization